MKIQLNQNRRIAMAALSIFVVSFSVVMFFIGGGENAAEHGSADVLQVGGHEETHGENHEKSQEEFSEDYHALTGSEDPLFVVDVDGAFEFVEEGFTEKLGMSVEELEGKLFFDFVNAEDISELAILNTKIFKEKETIQGVGPFRMYKEDGELVFIFDLTPVIDEEEVEKVIFTVRDLTDKFHKLLEQEELENATWTKYLYPKVKELKEIESGLILGSLGV